MTRRTVRDPYGVVHECHVATGVGGLDPGEHYTPCGWRVRGSKLWIPLNSHVTCIGCIARRTTHGLPR